MLYVTTRSNSETFTSNRALTENRGPDGGLYVPLHMPCFTPEEIKGLKDKPLGQRMADVLNLFFGTRLSGWDLDLTIGKSPVRLVPVGRRELLVESWHNPEGNFDWLVRSLSEALTGIQEDFDSEWLSVAARIGVLFCAFGALMEQGIAGKVDVSVPSGDFSGCVAAWYARQMGLPIGNIICCCNENGAPWDLIHRGELRTNSVALRTSTPLCDQVIPRDLERLVFACGGYPQAESYVLAVRRGGMYCPDEATAKKLREGLFVSVIGERRMKSTIYTTTSRIIGPYTALAYSGLLDYRARTGESRYALILSERSPLCDGDTVAEAKGFFIEKLNELLK